MTTLEVWNMNGIGRGVQIRRRTNNKVPLRLLLIVLQVCEIVRQGQLYLRILNFKGSQIKLFMNVNRECEIVNMIKRLLL